MAFTYGSESYCSTYNNTAANKYVARLGWELQSQSVDNNSSTFKIRLQVRSNNSSYYTYGTQTTTINGTKLSSASFNCKTSWITFGTVTVTITHDSDGKLPATTISGSFTTNVKETYALTGGSASVTIGAESIPPIDIIEPEIGYYFGNVQAYSGSTWKIGIPCIYKNGTWIFGKAMAHGDDIN